MAPKNILLIIADDLDCNLGICGESKVKTPNLDAFAAQGTYFDMAFASTASCSGSRSVIQSGLHTHLPPDLPVRLKNFFLPCSPCLNNVSTWVWGIRTRYEGTAKPQKQYSASDSPFLF
ncbi:alkaline-phosphatase-like protein [Lipomyces kononenkoae]